ncbi:hypothetical protein WUBG_02582 [Wuchereria bancrofti]|uniref:Uncharacterized protein n=1 Tax=Wuchereria bancrofti TaxID=6293 RepID=J9FGN5_WUCBA|nr:hypothetical protein WUBG_02582 [Wuchereria bancrofti]
MNREIEKKLRKLALHSVYEANAAPLFASLASSSASYLLLLHWGSMTGCSLLDGKKEEMSAMFYLIRKEHPQFRKILKVTMSWERKALYHAHSTILNLRLLTT